MGLLLKTKYYCDINTAFNSGHFLFYIIGMVGNLVKVKG